jgi:CheY-specific phosphatase CheX
MVGTTSDAAHEEAKLREAARVEHCLRESVEEVLETMFFLTVEQEVEWAEVCEKEHLFAEMDFQGAAEGRLELAVSADLAPMLAGGFFGKDESELSEAEVRGVVCELANMLCGSVLSRLESGSLFALGAPQMMTADLENLSRIHPGHRKVFDLGCGDVKLCFWMWREPEAA